MDLLEIILNDEHIDRWLGGRAPGATITVSKLSELAHAWWGDRVSPDCRPHPREQNQAILDRLGLTPNGALPVVGLAMAVTREPGAERRFHQRIRGLR